MPNRPTTPKFGVEIECGNEDMASAARALRDVGLFSGEYDWLSDNRAVPRGWMVCYEHCGMEIKSPPLAGGDGRRQIRVVCRALRDSGARVGHAANCGLHVHHDVADFNVLDMKNLVQSWLNCQPALWKFVAHERVASSWCAPLERTMVDRLDRADGQVRDVQSIRELVGSLGRYKSLNVGAWAAHGTVEVRMHQGTLNAKKIIAWVRLTQAILQATREGFVLNPLVASQADDLLTTLRGFGLPQRTADYLSDRVSQLEARSQRSGARLRGRGAAARRRRG